MSPAHKQWLLGLLMRLGAPIPSETVSDWDARSLVFQEPNCNGPFSFAGREYLREPLDAWSDPRVTDEVLCFGTRTGKTRILFGGLAWTIVHEPSRVLYVMPNTHGTGGARNVSTTRWLPMLRASAELATLLPSGARRHSCKALQQVLGGSIVDWTGSNSPGNLASNPARVVVQDEVDKYRRSGEKEADPSKLADERGKEFSNPKRFKASTPTLVSGLIWQELLKTDLRRRFLPCPHCQKFVVFAWSKEFTLLPKTGAEAYVRWDPDAKKGDDWDLERVAASAHALCPHCQGKILDTHKAAMDLGGQWRPTQTGAAGFRGYHLPSMYCASRQTNFGEMAKRFLQAKNSIAGLQGFINADLAEPYQAQDLMGKRTELIIVRAGEDAGARRIMTGDCQARKPHFWYVVRSWQGANSEGIAAGSCDRWEELRAIQLEHKVQDLGVFIDSGWGAKSEAEVYRNCASYCEIIDQSIGLPLAIGWTPAKGMPGHKKWLEKDTGLYLPYYLRPLDPFGGTADAGKVSMGLFEFSADFFKDILQNLRAGQGGFQWAVPQAMATEEYWRHLDGQYKVASLNKWDGRVRMRWIKRSAHWPDHLFACEVEQVAAANFFGLFPIEEEVPAKT